MYGLLLPNKCDSPAAKKKNPHPSKSHDSHKTTGDVTTITSDPGATATVEFRHRDHLSPAEVSSSKREGESSEVMTVRVSDLVRQFDDTDGSDQVRVRRRKGREGGREGGGDGGGGREEGGREGGREGGGREGDRGERGGREEGGSW